MREDSDRAAGVLAGAILETRLERALRSKLCQGSKVHEEKTNQLFRPSGPIGSFSAIDLGLLLGFYSETVWKELVTIKKIRNAFAHQLAVTSFDASPVSDWVQTLTL